MTPDADGLLALARQFMESRILLTAAELDLFTLLAPEPLAAEATATKVDGDERAVRKLLDALVGMELLVKRDDRYQTPRGLAPLLTQDTPQSVRPMLRHMDRLWDSWSALTGVVQGDAAAGKRARAGRDEADTEAFIKAMHVVASPLAPKVVAAINPGRARALLDIGGAAGTYVRAFLRACPGMQATLFDLPEVLGFARERLEAEGLLERVNLVGGDFYDDELPGGHDLALLSAIIHQNSPAQNVELYRKVHRALMPGGRLVIRDYIMSDDHTAPRPGAVFAINMLVRTAGGSTYSYADCETGLREAGFDKISLIQAGRGMDGLVEAIKP